MLTGVASRAFTKQSTLSDKNLKVLIKPYWEVLGYRGWRIGLNSKCGMSSLSHVTGLLS
jgi:hypothetical protein